MEDKIKIQRHIRYTKDKIKIRCILNHLYRGMVRRSKKKRENISLTKIEFLEFYQKNNKEFLKIYYNWIKNGCCPAYSVSIDRINNSLGYGKDNIQFITLRENSSKGRKNNVSSKLTEYVGVYQTKNKKYEARLCHRGGQIYIGTFKTPIAAAMEVNKKCKELKIPIKNRNV